MLCDCMTAHPLLKASRLPHLVSEDNPAHPMTGFCALVPVAFRRYSNPPLVLVVLLLPSGGFPSPADSAAL